jgi:hypothetical protein
LFDFNCIWGLFARLYVILSVLIQDLVAQVGHEHLVLVVSHFGRQNLRQIVMFLPGSYFIQFQHVARILRLEIEAARLLLSLIAVIPIMGNCALRWHWFHYLRFRFIE